MRIAFTYNVKPKAAGADSGDRYAEWEDEATIVAVEAALSRAGTVIRVEANDDLPLRLHDLRPDMVFNIAEGIGGPNREAHVPAICEFWSTPYTGSDSMTMSLCLDKGRAKEVLAHHGIATAPFAVVGRPEELDGFAAWPAIVKPVHEGSSMGITRASFCPSPDEARREIADLVERYGQPAIVEGYLGGREFTCGILGNGAGGAGPPPHRGQLRRPAQGRAAHLLVRGEVDLGQAGGAPRHLPLPGAHPGRARGPGGAHGPRRLPRPALPGLGAHRPALRRARRAAHPRGQPAPRHPPRSGHELLPAQGRRAWPGSTTRR